MVSPTMAFRLLKFSRRNMSSAETVPVWAEPWLPLFPREDCPWEPWEPWEEAAAPSLTTSMVGREELIFSLLTVASAALIWNRPVFRGSRT